MCTQKAEEGQERAERCLSPAFLNKVVSFPLARRPSWPNHIYKMTIFYYHHNGHTVQQSYLGGDTVSPQHCKEASLTVTRLQVHSHHMTLIPSSCEYQLLCMVLGAGHVLWNMS